MSVETPAPATARSWSEVAAERAQEAKAMLANATEQAKAADWARHKAAMDWGSAPAVQARAADWAAHVAKMDWSSAAAQQARAADWARHVAEMDWAAHAAEMAKLWPKA